jgi:serine phosphatase RsbU (regulator of sigma subunit)
MKQVAIFCLLFIAISFPFHLSAQNTAKVKLLTDSLDKVSTDQDRALIYIDLAHELKKSDRELGYSFLVKAVQIVDTTTYKKVAANYYRQRGNYFLETNDHDSTIIFLFKALRLFEELDDPVGISKSQNSLGIAYRLTQRFEKSFEYLFKALESKQDNFDNAVTLLNISSTYGYKGSVEDNMALFDSSKAYAIKAFNVAIKHNNARVISGASLNLGNIFGMFDQKDSAYYYIDHSIQEFGKNNDYLSLAKAYKSELSLSRRFNDFDKAIVAGKNAEEMLRKIDQKDLLLTLYEDMYRVYLSQNDVNNALISINHYVDLHDTVFRQAVGQQSEKYDAIYQTEKKDREIEKKKLEGEKKDAEIARKNANIAKQRNLLFSGVGGAVLLLLLVFILVKRNREKRKNNLQLQDRNTLIQLQKQEVEEKNKEITDSITYAKRIQSAILPPDNVVKEYLKESFILYKPKDIVAGDFYWMEHVNDTVIFAAADCTGHGVPGAMVSVVCNNALNRSVREYGLTEPGKILDKAREIVIKEFEESDEDVKDGMDIALCALTGNKLEYAGAHNPLWIIRNGEIIETKANKQPIGKFDNSQPFTTHHFELQKGDAIYIFSDGYVDQFGGEKGKKFKSKAFKELLLSIQEHPMEKQCLLIDQTFEDWKGEIEQVDDVCIIGCSL